MMLPSHRIDTSRQRRAEKNNVDGHAPNPSTGDVLLRDVAVDDLPVFFEHQRDPEAANRMAAFPSRDRDAFMAHWAKVLADAGVTKKTILFDGRVAGSVVRFVQDGNLEVDYWIGREYWGKGVATEALSQFLIHVKERPLYGVVAKHNIASVRVLEKCGFALIGEEDEEYILKLAAD